MSGAMWCAPCACAAMPGDMSGMGLSLQFDAVRQDALDVGRYDLGGGAVDMFLEQGLVAAGFEVELDGPRAWPVAADMQHEARGGIDLARGADRHEQAAAVQHLIDLVHVHGHLAEPHDVRPELAHGMAMGAHRGWRQILVG